MKWLTRNTALVAGGIVVALLLAPQRGQAAVLTVEATYLFTPSGEAGLAYDVSPGVEHLYVLHKGQGTPSDPNGSNATLRAYSLLDPVPTLLAGYPVELADGTSIEHGEIKLGMHFVREATTVGGVAVPAGTLIVIRRGATQNAEVVLTAVNKVTGAMFSAGSSEDVDTSLPAAGCQGVLLSGPAGLGFSTVLDRFLSADVVCRPAVGELRGLIGSISVVSGAEVTGFFEVPGGLEPGADGQGDVKEHPRTRNLWVVGPPNRLLEFSTAGELLREFAVVDKATQGAIGLKRLAFDTLGQRLWLLTVAQSVYEMDVNATLYSSVPSLGPWGAMALALGLALSPFGLARWRRTRAR